MCDKHFHKNIGGIQGLILIEPIIYGDKRGSFSEIYNRCRFHEEGIVAEFVQDNEVYNIKGVLRGMHVNINNPQAKLIWAVKGKIYDVVIDLRKNSKTFKKIFCTYLSEENKHVLYIPEGFGHGYLSLTDSVIQFKVTTHYIEGDEIGFSWDSFDINWPSIGMEYILNSKDLNNPQFIDDLID